MPELPEVETVVRTLEAQIKGEKIIGIDIRWPGVIEGDRNGFVSALTGQHFRTFGRRGKYLLFGMDDVLLVAHMRMEGKFYVQKDDEPVSKHMHLIFQLSGHRQLRYHDTRKFGRMTIAPLTLDLQHFHGLGPEPFSEAFNADYIHAWRQGRTMPLKSMLLDQSFVAGVGNIYSDEILFACHLRPGRSCARITRKDEEAIVLATRRILKAAIMAGGTTIRSYTSSLGVTGRFQLQCCVHGQSRCRVCGSEIKIKRIGGRSSYYCPICQK